MRTRLRRAVAVVLLITLLVPVARATWSIIIIDLRTGEIAIGSATCLTGFDLRRWSPVVVVGVGAAAAQSFVDSTGANRQLIWTQLMQGVDPQQILAALAMQDPGHQTRQYGIVDVQGRAVGFTGTGAGAWAGHLTGTTGTLVYAIQGNVLTGLPVIQAAEQAILTTPGDLAAKLMAAMQAARMMGGDGRCSCGPSTPTACGVPPPSFAKSADIGYMIVARQGDANGACNLSVGCASGTYYMNHNIAFQTPVSPDPVIQLQGLYDAWRISWTGRPDHHLSTVTFSPPDLPADGVTTTLAAVRLRDWQGIPLATSNATVNVTLDPASSAPVTLGPVTPIGGGISIFPVTAGTMAGTALLRVTVNDGQGSVLLSPRAVLNVGGQPLWSSSSSISAATGGTVSFSLDAGPAYAMRNYVVAASASGSMPGIPLSPSLTIPLNPDWMLQLSLLSLNSAVLPNTLGALDAAGRASAALVATPHLLGALSGLDLTFAFATLSPLDYVSNPVVLHIN